MTPSFSRLRQFPSRIVPVPGQSLISYIDHLSASMPLKLPLVTLLYQTGLIDDEKVQDIGPGYGVALTAERTANFAWVTRLEPKQVQAMLLSHYDGSALNLSTLDITDANSVRRVARDNWGFFSTTRICPLCIAEHGAELLKWKLPVVFACTRHAVLLADTCPRCAHPFSHNRLGGGSKPLFASQVPKPGVCLNAPPVGYVGMGRSAMPCGQPLKDLKVADLKGHPRALRAQVQIEAVLEGQSAVVAGRQVSPAAYMQHLRSAAALLLYAAVPEDLGELPEVAFTAMRSYCQERDARLLARQQLRSDGDRGGPALIAYRGVQRSAALMMAVLPTAVEWLSSASVSELADRLLPMIERARDLKSNKVRLIGNDFSFDGPLIEALDMALSPRAEFDRRIGSLSRYNQKPGTPYDFTADEVPQLFWMPDFQHTFRPLFRESDMGDDYARRVISMALVKLCGTFSWVEAAAALGLPASSATGSANKLMGVIAALGRTGGFALALHRKAAELSASTDRTDYAALRRRFDTFTEIDYDLWSGLARLAGVMPGKQHGKNRFAAAWVWARITGGDFRLSPALAAGTSAAQRDQYARFLKDDFARLAPALEAFAASLHQMSTP